MAHGIIPPFSTHLICEDFLKKVRIGVPVQEDVSLLGEASNEVVVTQEVAEGFQSLLAQAYALYLAAGYEHLETADPELSPETRSLLVLLLGVALETDDAAETFAVVLSNLQREVPASWVPLVMGPLGSRIQSVEDRIGILIKEGAKDVYTHAFQKGGMEELERILCAA